MDRQVLNARTQLLIIQLRRGDKEVFVDLVDLWERRLFYFIRRIVYREQDAWDVLQETWLKAHTKLRHLKNLSSFPAWIYSIARNTAIGHLRHEQRHELLHEGVEQECYAVPDTTQFSAEQAELIHWGLDQLPLPQREVLSLFFLENFSLQEVAAITKVSTGTVKSRLHYGKRALREIIKQEERGHE